MFPLLEVPMFPSLYVQILPPTESLQGPRLPLTEDVPDLLLFLDPSSQTAPLGWHLSHFLLR